MNLDEELNELLNDPLLDLSEKEKSLFDIPADMKEVLDKREGADYIARRKVCEDFEQFSGLFTTLHEELKTGKRSLVRLTKTANITPGHFFVIGGQLLYLASMGEKKRNENNKRLDCRTRSIYENGTESNILLQTLRKGVMEDGFAITETQEGTELTMFSPSQLDKKDQVTGYIYVLKSLSAQPEIAHQPDLYKIGFTVNSVEERIANAANDPTYLLAPVKVEASYKIVNLNSQLFESLIHQVLDAVRMQFTITDAKGAIHHPKEWYVVPFPVIETIIKKIVNGTITQYIYNRQLKCLERTIVKRESTFDTKGMKVLTLNIKKVYFDEIMKGEKDIEFRELKQTTLSKYTYLDESDGKRYLRRYDALRLYVGYQKDRESAIVEVVDTIWNEGVVEYHLGHVLEHLEKEE
ncbi:MAG: GIY-YIG nuclease family protein [Phocaeicola sp.]